MNDSNSLWKACLANPDESDTRGRLADMLTEAGFTELAQAFRKFAGRAFVCEAAGLTGGTDYVTQLRHCGDPGGVARSHIQESVSDLVSHIPPAWRGRSDWALVGRDLELEEVDFDERGASVSFAFTLENALGLRCWGRALARFERDDVVIEVVGEISRLV